MKSGKRFNVVLMTKKTAKWQVKVNPTLGKHTTISKKGSCFYKLNFSLYPPYSPQKKNQNNCSDL